MKKIVFNTFWMWGQNTQDQPYIWVQSQKKPDINPIYGLIELS